MKYVAFFRGINVGGKNIVKMAELRKIFYKCGFQEVKTYIQSGNVIFESDLEQHELAEVIAHSFAEKFGFQSHVVLRSAGELSDMLNSLPFSKDDLERAEAMNPEVEHAYVFLSNDHIDPSVVEVLNQAYEGEDQLVAGKRELYLLCHQSVRNSKLAASMSKLNTPLTARNQKSLCKILALLNGDD